MEASHLELGRPLTDGVRAALSVVKRTQPKTPLEFLDFAVLQRMLAEILQDPAWKQEAVASLEKVLPSQKEDGAFIYSDQVPHEEMTLQAVERLMLLSRFEELVKEPIQKALHFLASSADNRLSKLAKAYLALLDQESPYSPLKEAIQGLKREEAVNVLTILHVASKDPAYLTEARTLLNGTKEDTQSLLEILVWKNSGYSVDFYPKELSTRMRLARSLALDAPPFELAGVLGYVMGEQHRGFAASVTSALGDFSPFIDEKIDPTHSITGDSIVLGARGAVHREVDGLLYLGRVTEHAPEEDKFGYAIQVDATFPHVILIAGMRGSGKSYTLGVLAEELARTDIGIGVIIVDPLGVFWSMKLPNSDAGERKLIEKWHLVPKGHPEKVRVFIPLGYYDDYPEESKDAPFAIAPTELEAGDWAFMFKIDLQSPMGLLLRQAVERVQKGYQSAREGTTILVPGKGEKYTIRDLIECISTDVDLISKERGFAKATRRALVSRFMQVQSWGLFSSDQATPIHELSKPGQVSVIDVSFLSTVEPGSVALVVGLLARRILQERIRIGRAEESAYLTGTTPVVDASAPPIPITWVMVDEAHMLVPEGERTAASQPLIEFAKQGRKPGCGLILATQRPAATSDQVLSQVDLVLCHALVLEDDLRALLKRTPAKLPQEFKSPDFIRTLPVGAAIVADQRTPLRSLVARTRPRTSSHAGKAAIPSKIMRAAPVPAVEPVLIEQKQWEEKKEIPMDTTAESVEVQPSTLTEAPSIEPELMAGLPPTTVLPPAVIQGYLSRKLLYGFKDFFFPPSRAHRTTETGFIALEKDQWQAVQDVIRSEGWGLKSSMEQEDIAIQLWETLRGRLGFATIQSDGRVQAVWAYVGTDSAEIAFLEEYNNP